MYLKNKWNHSTQQPSFLVWNSSPMSGLSPPGPKQEQRGTLVRSQDQGPNICEPTILSAKDLFLNGIDFSVITSYKEEYQ